MTTPRIVALDGLRGIASLVVLFHHLSLLDPEMSDVFLAPGSPAPAVGTAAWVLTATPAALLVMGQEAVLVFFVLSGLAVTLPALRADFDWFAYYPRRIVRLMLPVVAAVALGAALILAFPRDPATAVSDWAGGSTFAHLPLGFVVESLDLLYGTPYVDNPLWSLRYELLFSILLPLFVVAALTVRRLRIPVAIAALLVVAYGSFAGDDLARYLPGFLLGALLAAYVSERQSPDVVDASSGRRSAGAHLRGAGVLLLALIALAAHWILRTRLPDGDLLTTAGPVLATAGATALVALATFWRPLARLLSTPIARWLGRVSFSLYLVHVPIVVAVSWLLPAVPWYLMAAVALPIALLVAEVFARLVEAPAHRLSKSVGSATRRLLDRRHPTVPPS